MMNEEIDISLTVTNPDGLQVQPELMARPVYDEYLDKPRRMSVKVAKSGGFDPQGTVKVERRGKIILLGHIKKHDQGKRDLDTLTIDSAEALLDERIGQFYRYPAGTTLNDMLASEMGGSVVGLLAMANGLIPNGAWTLHSGSVYKIVGAGTSSRFGTLTTLYQNTTALTKVTAIPVSAGRWYQSSTDLYIWTTDSKSPKYHLIIAPNYKDTLVRLGTISTGTTTFAVCYEVGANKILPAVKSLILAGGLEYNIRYGKDGYAYLDGAAAVGRGSASEPTVTYIDGDSAEISLDVLDGYGRLQAMIGQGAGNGITQETAAAIDFTTQGTWREGIYQAGGLFGEMLRAATAKVFEDCQNPTIYNVRAIDQDWSQAVGNWVGVKRPGHMTAYARIKHIQMREAGDMILEVGQRLRTIQELLKAGEEVQRTLSSFYGAHTKNAWSWGIDAQNIDSSTPLTISFDLKSSEENGEIDPNFPYQVLLSVRLDWYKSSVKSATVSGPTHSAVGSHSGYGGGETSDEEMTAHIVSEKNTTTAYDGLFDIYAYSGWGPYTGQSMGWWGHDHDLGDIIIEGIAYVEGEYEDCLVDGYMSMADPTSKEYAEFGPDSRFLNVSGPHNHKLPTHYTHAAGDQSHTESLESAKTRAGSAQHADQTLDDATEKMEFLVNQLSTGSPALLVLSIKCNGSHVPGSPFDGGTGLYVGDSLDNIDISSLVSVGSTNSLVFELSEYGGAALVRCALAGNVNVSAVISSF